MKWITHQTGAIIASITLGLPPCCAVLSCFGSIAPDLMDQRISRLAPGKTTQKLLFKKIHRGSSHWFGWWIGVLFLCFCYPFMPVFRDIILGIAFGGLTHIVLDMLTPGGVPLLPFSRKPNVSINLCSTGTYKEYIFLVVMIFLSLFLLKDRFMDYYQLFLSDLKHLAHFLL